MNLKTYRVTLDVTVKCVNYTGEPGDWEWETLLDLGPNENVSVVSCVPAPAPDKTELLAELKACLRELESGSGYDRQDQIRALIARAEGGEESRLESNNG